MILTDKTIADLKVFFGETHKPSERMWEAITDLAQTLERMANGGLEPSAYLSRLDPGVGKTSTATHFIRNLLESEDHKAVGVLYCVSRVKEIPGLKAEIGNGVAVLTSANDFNAKHSTKEPWEARVLITTQQMVDSRLSKARSFSGLEEFHYLGRPRQVRIWDEAMLPAEELTLNVHSLGAMGHHLGYLGNAFKEKIADTVAQVRALPDKSTYEFPDFVAEFGIDYDRLLNRARGKETRIRETARSLYLVSGKAVTVRKDYNGHTMLDYRNRTKEDFYPIVILDASGRVRATYDLWARYRRDLTLLKDAGKKYSNLTVHLWNKGGGKDSWRNDTDDLAGGVIQTINSKPSEKWLVVVHHEDEGQDRGQKRIPDLKSIISNGVSTPENVSFLEWGNAHATNEFKSCTNVILAGTLFYPEPIYEIRARLCTGLSPEEEVSELHFAALERGEHCDLILQAACRGSIRESQDGEGKPMDLYIIAHKSTGIHDAIPSVFGGCTVKVWAPVERGLQGRLAKEVLGYLLSHFKAPQQIIPFDEVRKALGVKHSSHLNRVWKHPLFREKMKAHGIRAVSKNGSKRITQFVWLPETATPANDNDPLVLDSVAPSMARAGATKL